MNAAAGPDDGAGATQAPASPYQSLRPAGASPPPAVTADGRVRGPLGLLVNDAGLKLLAVLLAFMLWHLVRGRIETTDALLVDVELRVENEDVRVAGGALRRNVRLALRGSRSEVERVKSELVRAGSRIGYAFTAPPGREGRIGPLASFSRFLYPAGDAAAVVEDMSPLVEATWHRVETRPVRLVSPPDAVVVGRDDVAAEVELLGERTLRVTAPSATLAGLSEVPHDPVDVRAWLAGDPDLQTPFPFEVGFSRWRSESPSTRGTDLVELDPPRVRGRVRFQQVGTRTLTGPLRLELPGTDPDAYRAHEVVVHASTAYDPATKSLTAEVRGPTSAIEAMRRDPASWSFVVALPPPPSAAEPAVAHRDIPVLLRAAPDAPAARVRLAAPAHVAVTLRRR